MLLAARGGRHQPLASLGIGRVGLLGQGRQGQADGQPGKGIKRFGWLSSFVVL
jgi:hypothetical protein